MADPRFYKKEGPFTLGELAAIGQCEVRRGDPSLLLEDVAPLDGAKDGCISVFHKVKYEDALKATEASACILEDQMISKAPSHTALLLSPHPYRSYALISSAFYPPEQREEEIHPTAVVHPTALLGRGVRVGPFAVIGAHVEVGDFVDIGALAAIGEGVRIGDHSVIESHVSVSHAFVGCHVRLKPGARIGQSGFGFFMDEKGHVSVPQLGRVVIEDYVEIGSNTTVDRGSGPDTIIGLGTRIDNLVQVAHNVHFGKGCVMVAQTGVAGSTKFGDYVAAGGQVGIAEHLHIGTGARLAAQCGIMHDVNPGEVLAGSPAMPLKTHYRQVAVLKKLAQDTRKKI